MRKSILSALEDHSTKLSLLKVDEETAVDGSFVKNESSSNNGPAAATSAIDYAKIVWDVTAQNTKAPVAHEMIVLFMAIVWVAIVSIIGFARSVSMETRALIVGVSVNANLVFFYGAPLSTIFTVLRTKSSDSIHIPTMITNTLNGTFWAAYGIAIFDWFIAVPNSLGAVLGCVQFVLCVLFPRKDRLENEAATDNNNETMPAPDEGPDFERELGIPRSNGDVDFEVEDTSSGLALQQPEGVSGHS